MTNLSKDSFSVDFRTLLLLTPPSIQKVPSGITTEAAYALAVLKVAT
jgi:hypothetical protein